MNAQRSLGMVLALLIALGQATISRSQEGEQIVVEPQGEFANIDTSKSVDVLKKLDSLNRQTITAAIKEITADPDQFAPPVLYTVSDRLFRLGKKEDAAFFFYLGQVRGRSDANKSNDESARSAVAVLNMQFGDSINQYTFRELDVLKATVDKVIAWDRDHERHYDPRWIALHGLGAFTDSKLAFEPKENWKKIDEKTRTEWFEGFQEVQSQARRFDKDANGKLSAEESDAWRESFLAEQPEPSETEADESADE